MVCYYDLLEMGHEIIIIMHKEYEAWRNIYEASHALTKYIMIQNEIQLPYIHHLQNTKCVVVGG